MENPTNHEEAYEYACMKRQESNLARCYLELHAHIFDDRIDPYDMVTIPYDTATICANCGQCWGEHTGVCCPTGNHSLFKAK